MAVRIVVDSREQIPYDFRAYDVETTVAALPVGDYSLQGFNERIAVERKSLNDLVGCLMGTERDRFKRELARGRALERFVVVIESDLRDLLDGRYRSKMNPKAAFESVVAFYIRFGTSFLWAGDRQGAERMTFSVLAKFFAEIEKRYRCACKAA